ncbi:SAM-dependent methyltransferase [Verrucomicrobiales bacterium]|nr:SAM-dependent methyltransferase [Verrucomicrobiales bacterium]
MSNSSPAVETALREAIAASPTGNIPFSRFMEIALYGEPGGYYTAGGAADIGRKGDFFTSVSVGECFGFLLSHTVADCWRSAGEPESFRLIEPGARDGQLSKDVIAGLATHTPALAEKIETIRVEPGGGPYRSLAEIPASTIPGILIANEVIDALPVHRVRFADNVWHEIYITTTPSGFAETLVPPTEALTARLATIPTQEFPQNYTTEINLAQRDWLADAARALPCGHHLLFDYGHRVEDYYLPSRHEGTLRTYRDHKAGDDPLDAPGTRDMTTHVDFTALAKDGSEVGLVPTGFADQHHALTRAAAPWLRSLDGDPKTFRSPETQKRLRQFQTLTHPTMMGQKFHLLALTSGDASPAPLQKIVPKLDL